MAYMEENNLFNPGQHGFRLGRSCLSQLIAHYDLITRLLESGRNVDVIYIDFAKAFDKVDYLVTMKKLKGMGISGKLGRWIHAFLTNRKQAVVVNGTKSMPADVKSGVPQGSVLGPLLFLVLIGDIDREVATDLSQVLRMTLEQPMASRPMQTFVTYKLISMPYIIKQMKTIWNSTTQSLNVYDMAAIMT